MFFFGFASVLVTWVLQTSTNACPPGWSPHPNGFWSNPWPCGLNSTNCTADQTNTTLTACGQKCEDTAGCLAFEVYQAPPKTCYLFRDKLQLPFHPDPDCATCVSSNHSGPPAPAPAPLPPQHTFPRLGNCWGADPFITNKMWRYLGYNVTNSSWGDYDVLYINPFDSCCWKKEMDSWLNLIRAIKQANPSAVVLATFHATEIWQEDLVAANRW